MNIRVMRKKEDSILCPILKANTHALFITEGSFGSLARYRRNDA
jgi:hypothetical protein